MTNLTWWQWWVECTNQWVQNWDKSIHGRLCLMDMEKGKQAYERGETIEQHVKQALSEQERKENRETKGKAPIS